ncbi:MarR family winged helix-turn-helix transcriptional regulator [Sedimenticola thiotaurini]|nr:MarR family transcriptional regulator [Sedimenticola thiotaurini]
MADNEMTTNSEEPRVELESFIPYRLSVLSNFVSSSIATIYSERFNISIMEWRVIAVLGNYQPLSANEICERTNMDKVQVSRAVSSLTKSGRVLRKTDKKDRRKSQLRLAAKGMKVYQQIVPLALEREKKLLAPFNENEIAEFDRLLSKLETRARELCATD